MAEKDFPHLAKAYEDVQAKALQNTPVEERIAKVKQDYPDADKPIEHSELFRLHNVLTGSCVMGRTKFAKAHDLDPENGTMTMREFITLTKDAFGGDVIRQLAEATVLTFNNQNIYDNGESSNNH